MGTPKLSRSLRPRHVALIGLGGVIGAGLFVGSSASIHAVGPAVVLSFLAAGAIVYAVMSIVSVLATAFPGTQAFTELVRRASGNSFGFVVGWLYWYLWVVILAIEALAGGAILQSWIHAPLGLLSAGLVLVMMTINLMPTRSFGEFEFWFASIKVLAIVMFIVTATVMCWGTHAARMESWNHLSGLPGGFMPHGWSSVLTGVVTVFFSLTGAELSTIAAEEAREADTRRRGVASVLIGRIILFYVASVFLIVCMVPWTSIVSGTSPFATALYAHGVGWAGNAMTLVILTAVLSCLNSAFFISSRVLFVLASHGDAPKQLVRLTSRSVPAGSVVSIAVCAAACLLAATLASSAFAFLVNASGALILIIYLAICIAYLRHARNESTGGHKLTACLTGIAMLCLLANMASNPDLAPQLYTSLAALLLSIAVWAVRLYGRRTGILGDSGGSHEL